MGCDIHLVIEYRPVIGYSRPDSDVRTLLRAIDASPGDATLTARLRSWEVVSESWEPACFDFYNYDSDEEEDADTVHRSHEVSARRGLRANHPERFHVNPERRWSGIYSVLPIEAKWPQGHLSFCDDRSYEAFALLTGTVRNYDRVPAAECFTDRPRGMPGDASAYARALAEGWEGDGHSHSWLTIAEMIPRVGRLGQSGYADMVRWWATHLPPERVRLVFFFDN